MTGSRIHSRWEGASAKGRFRTGVSLHSHTLHSRESLTFLYRAAARFPLLAWALSQGQQRYRDTYGATPDPARGWWTPPLGPHQAWALEKAQLNSLGLHAIVSLTDHDNIDAPLLLRTLDQRPDIPISFEWTLPFGATFFHLGIHNLPVPKAPALYKQMQDYTRAPRPSRLAWIGEALSECPDVLVVLNHPLWDESHAGTQVHREAARELVSRFGRYLHALELNGLRPWCENKDVIAFADSAKKSLISGGDRHGLEPNAILNVTNAATFAEFVEEVRCGWSDILIMPQYRERHGMRVAQHIVDILRDHEHHSHGWRLWSDRVFYHCVDGCVRCLTQLLGKRVVAPVSAVVGLAQFASQPSFRRFLRGAILVDERTELPSVGLGHSV
jgi:hypothetical protein